MSDDLVEYLKAPVVLGEKAVGPGELVEQMLSKMSEAANRIEADTKLIQEMREPLHGPYGWLTGNIGLNEEYWTVEADEVKDGEFFSIPLYAKVDPIALSKAKSQQEGETE